MKKIKNNIGLIIVVILTIIPLLLWILIPKIENPFSDFKLAFSSFGEIAGLMGMVLFALDLVLATRLSFIEKSFSGLHNLYNKHSWIGQIALILILFHPILLISSYADNFNEAAIFLWIGTDWALNFGIISLVTMIVIIVLTLYLRPKFNLWFLAHKVLGFAFILGVLHVYLIPNEVLVYKPLKYYVFTMSLLGIISFLYKTVFEKYLVKKHKYTVIDIKKLNSESIELSLKPINQPIQFKAGQFIFISFYQYNILSESHPFSISSSPDSDIVKISVKALGDYTHDLIKNLEVNTLAKIEGAFGVFSYSETENKKQIWIAGGIGITPFLSWIKDLTEKHEDYDVEIYYCVKNSSHAVYLSFLEETSIANCFPLRVVPYYSDDGGHINYHYIKQVSVDFMQRDVFMCAPSKMMDSLNSQFLSHKISKEFIHSKKFDY